MNVKEMFEKLGYKVIKQYDETLIVYEYTRGNLWNIENMNKDYMTEQISFNKRFKDCVQFYSYNHYYNEKTPRHTTIEDLNMVLKAIQKQIEELGW